MRKLLLDMPFQVDIIFKKQKKKKKRKIHENIEKNSFCQGTLTAFIYMKIDKYFNMKILNIYNILLAKSLGGVFSQFCKIFCSCPWNSFQLPWIWWGLPGAVPCACATTLLGDLQGCWNVQRQGTLRQREKKRAQPSSSHTNLNRRGVGRRRVTVELSSFVICGDRREICSTELSVYPFLFKENMFCFMSCGCSAPTACDAWTISWG